MALQFVLGNSGAGKTEYVYQQVLRQADAHPDKRYFMIVPEQFTMATQRGLVLRQHSHAILNIDVLSFDRLAYRVFEELGESRLQILEDTGKNLMIQKLVGDLNDQLVVLSGSMHKPGMVDEIKSFLTELTQYRILPQDLSAMAELTDVTPLLKNKLQDLRLIYEQFRQRVDEKFLLAEEVVEYLSTLVSRSRLFTDTTLVFDGFTGFTPVQMDFLRSVFPVADDVLVALTIDGREDLYTDDGYENLFYLSKKTIRSLMQLAKETGVEVQEPVVLADADQKRFQSSPVLSHLEQNLFRLGRKPYVCRQQTERQQLQLYHFTKPQEELQFAAREIQRLVREQGYRYRDIAIVTGDLSGYSKLVDSVFADYDIPYFLDETNQLLFHPLMELVGGLLELAESHFSYESVMRILKAGFGFDGKTVDQLDNYLLAYGIRGNAWKKPWERLPDWLSAQELEEINALRQQLYDILGRFEQAMNGQATVRERTISLYETLISLHATDHVEPRIWKLLMELLEKMTAILGEEPMSLADYKKIVEAGFEAVEVAYIPIGYDQVIIGDIERTRLENIKVLFFIGVVDGVIPNTQTDGGILSQLERELLARQDYELAPTAKERAFIQRFYLYMNLTKPSDRLYVTYAMVGEDGSSRRPSYLVGLLLRLFPSFPLQEDKREPADNLYTPAGALGYFVEGLKQAREGIVDDTWLSLFAWYETDDEWKQKIEPLLEAAFYRWDHQTLSKKLTQELYGTVLENSVSRLERFASCAYAHFLNYGLGLRERQQYEFAANDFGNLVHTALEDYAKALRKEGQNWFDVSEEMIHELCDDAMESAMMRTNDALFSSARNRYLATRIRRLFKQTVDTLEYQVKKGRFLPYEYELGFGGAGSLHLQEFQLADGEVMRLRGRIDRVDLLQDAHETYVKIIDYKSGRTQFSLPELYFGLQLQLVVYLNAAMELMKKKQPKGTIEPAGIFYYHVDDPVIETSGEMDETQVQKTVLEKLRLDGIVNADPQVVEAMDEQFTDKSDVIPVSRKTNGELSRTSKAYSREELWCISDYVKATVQELGERLMQGEIAPNPYELGDKSACDYCRYQSVCGFDERLNGCKKRTLSSKLDQEEMFSDMQRKIDRNQSDRQEES